MVIRFASPALRQVSGTTSFNSEWVKGEPSS